MFNELAGQPLSTFSHGFHPRPQEFLRDVRGTLTRGELLTQMT